MESDCDAFFDLQWKATCWHDYARLLEEEDERIYKQRLHEIATAQKVKNAKLQRAARHQGYRARPENKTKESKKYMHYIEDQ